MISAHQLGFIPGDFTVDRLLHIYHELCLAKMSKRKLVIFLDISKAFDKAVWHSGLLFKLKKNGVSGNLFGWFLYYLNNHISITNMLLFRVNLLAGVRLKLEYRLCF